MVSSFTESRCAESAAAATAAAVAPTSSWPRLRCWLRGAAVRPGETRAGVAALTKDISLGSHRTNCLFSLDIKEDCGPQKEHGNTFMSGHARMPLPPSWT
ncbi:hypothetical protein QTO34_017030 [Cnephaeus nilssonii]|uniref:Uncharacterized protein n=1 Tax=Cnephaeus nilssonii TaxID=3371016 RepID=A0AA40I146_CNENI|nr:hypothetical protein QTO34_017030 [Eptesicus nilssonii]